MKNRNLYIIVALVLVAALVLSFFKLTGQVTNPSGDIGDCTDTDGGDDKYVKGTASYKNRDYKYIDYCYDRTGTGTEKYLNEYYCIDKIAAKNYFCENGCNDGACVK